ncbi:MAG: hypothetical protein AAF919_07180 [Pseudomonadota bacterium]
MTRTITTLRPAETVAFDHETLAELCETYGEEAEVFIATVLGEIEAHLTKADDEVKLGEHDGLARTCRNLVILAKSIGMRTLDTCANSVLACLASDDQSALSACTARLTRLGHPESFRAWTVGSPSGSVA